MIADRREARRSVLRKAFRVAGVAANQQREFDREFQARWQKRNQLYERVGFPDFFYPFRRIILDSAPPSPIHEFTVIREMYASRWGGYLFSSFFLFFCKSDTLSDCCRFFFEGGKKKRKERGAVRRDVRVIGFSSSISCVKLAVYTTVSSASANVGRISVSRCRVYIRCELASE